MNQRLAIIIFAFAFVVALVAGLYSPSEVKPTPSDFRARLRENLPIGAPSSVAPKPKTGTIETHRRDPAAPLARLADAQIPTQGPGLDRDGFLRKYGDSIRFVPARGPVTRIDGTSLDPASLQGSQRVPGFRPSSADDLRARADEILRDAHDLLGLNPNQQWLGPTIQPGDTSGQVFYQQGIDGVPLYPNGIISIVLGADGEPRSLDSSAYPVTRVMNSRTLGAPENSRTILYVTQTDPVVQARYAYETRDATGVQRVTDAQTGEVLLERDRKIK